MNHYVNLVSDAIEYMEKNLDQPFQVSHICQELHISEYHFNRFFSAISGMPPKKYLSRRRLTQAARELKETDDKVTDIAMRWGFNYTEDFSRSFKKYFNMSPLEFRNSNHSSWETKGLDPISKLSCREFINRRGKIELKAAVKHFESMDVMTETISVSKAENYFNILHDRTISFLSDTKSADALNQSEFYCLVKCDPTHYRVDLCKQIIDSQWKAGDMKTLPEGWYACFQYDGDTDLVYEDFERDLYTWAIQKEVIFRDLEFNMASRYLLKDEGVVLGEIRIPIDAIDQKEAKSVMK